MARALDHLVLATRDLAGLATRFESLGFTVGRRNRHPWGTENHIVQFRSTFLELIGFAADYRSLVEGDVAYPFAGFLERYLDRHESGIAMAVLRSSDARADAVRFAREGLGTGQVLPFSRVARGPDGSDRTVAFTIAFAAAPSMPGIGFFTCEQHRPENFWSPALQRHANGAEEITGLEILAEDPEAQGRFLAGFADQQDRVRVQNGIAVDLDGGRITVFAARHPGMEAHIHLAEVRLEDRCADGLTIDAAAGWRQLPGESGEAICITDAAATLCLRFIGPSER